jgi:hypothetical protein
MKLTIKQHAMRLARNARQSMRECALGYRKAYQCGDVKHMLRWLILAANFRDIARGYLEAA